MNKQQEQIEGKGIGGFGMIPDFVSRLGLSPEALCLYVHYKATVHEGEQNRRCSKSTRTLCQETSLSAEKVRRAKKELLEHSLISIERQLRKDGGRSSDLVTVLNVWERNIVPPTAEKRSRVGKAQYPPAEKPTYPTSETPQQSQSNLSDSDSSERGAPAPEPLTVEKYKDRISKALASGIAMHNGFTGAIEFEFHIRPTWKTKTAREFVEYMAVEWQPTADDVHRFAQWWREHDWRGQKGQAPSLKDIRENWPQAFVTQDEFTPVEVYE